MSMKFTTEGPNSMPKLNTSASEEASVPGSSSPVAPPISPITPVFGNAQLPSSTPTAQQEAPSRIYTHIQPPQTFMPPPSLPPETVSLDDNPDSLALKSALSILQLQRNRATADMQTLQKIKERALADPEAFIAALETGQMTSRPSGIFPISASNDAEADEDNEDDDDGSNAQGGTLGSRAKSADVEATSTVPPKWPMMPTPQTVVRTPPINWAQYGVVGESLDKLHADQVTRPVEGQPHLYGTDGRASDQSNVVRKVGGQRREAVIAAPYVPGKDKFESLGSKEGGK